MGAHDRSSRLRMVMDICLVIAVVIAIGAYLRPSAASAQLPAPTQVLSTQGSPGDITQDQPVTSTLDTVVVSSTVTLDIKTLAAIIAAENAALAQPLYSISMPVITR